MRRPIPGPDGPRRRLALAAALLAALAGAGCAKKAPPSGGPPDLDPPRIESVSPDSGAAGVPRDVRVAITFSEGMEPRGTGESVEFSPPLTIRQRRWSGRTLTLVLAESLGADRTYTLFIGGNARDRHGNNLVDSRTIVFTTAATFPAGRLEGVVEAVGFQAPGTLLWCYRGGREPDSTARDFDALGVADRTGAFRVAGLETGVPWRVWAFADLNHNRSFEPETDILEPADTVVTLSAEHPVATDVRLKLTNTRAPGRLLGVVTDTLGDASGSLRLIVTPVADSTRRVLYEVPASGSFDLRWDPGLYRVRAFRDRDRDRAWKRDAEPASFEIELRITPGGELKGVTFVLFMHRGGIDVPVPPPPSPAAPDSGAGGGPPPKPGGAP
jgi:hypothetical protein